MLIYLWVAAGGALGSVLRLFLATLIGQQMGESFPWGTLLINVTGSFAITFFATLTGPSGRWLVNPTGRAFFMAGVCGGYTTFSSFSLQTLNLAQEREWLYAGSYIVASVILCLVAAWLGFILAASLNSTKGSS